MSKRSARQIVGDQELARHYVVTPKTVYSWRQIGLPHREEGRQYVYDLDKTDPWVEVQQRAKPSTQELGPGAKLKLAREAERLKQDRIKASMMEREEAAALGNVLNRDEWELFAIEVVQQARDQIMRLPKMLCKHVPAKYRRVLQFEGERDVRKILEEMARSLEHGVKD